MPTRGAGRGVVVIAHGFKGYKDYGMFPRLAREFAGAGLVVHRFNFSHSGMTRRIDAFERPDLFERDTWRKQIFDLHSVLAAIAHGELAGGRLPMFVLGHSRGGTTAILAAARLTYPESIPDPPDDEVGATTSTGGHRCAVEKLATSGPLAGVITLAAPSGCNPLTLEQQTELLEQGWIESPSSRTGQRLRVGREFLQEQLDDPVGHDLLAHGTRLACPLLVIHGDADASVPVQAAHEIVRAAGGLKSSRPRLRVIAGADHVFNVPNPLPDDQPVSPQLQEAIDESLQFIESVIERPV